MEHRHGGLAFFLEEEAADAPAIPAARQPTTYANVGSVLKAAY